MPWLFHLSDSIFPDHVAEDVPTDEDTIVETAYTGCAWCGDGDANGICPKCEAKYFPKRQSGGGEA